MTRRSYLLSSQRIDLVQRRRARSAVLVSEQPTPVDIRRLSGTGPDPGQGAVLAPRTWLAPGVGWLDSEVSWLG